MSPDGVLEAGSRLPGACSKCETTSRHRGSARMTIAHRDVAAPSRFGLTHDDRPEPVAHFQRGHDDDVDQAVKAMRDEEIEDFLEGFNQPT